MRSGGYHVSDNELGGISSEMDLVRLSVGSFIILIDQTNYFVFWEFQQMLAKLQVNLVVMGSIIYFWFWYIISMIIKYNQVTGNLVIR